MSDSIATRAEKIIRANWPASPDMLAMIVQDVANTTEVETLTSAASALFEMGERKAAGLLHELAGKKLAVIAEAVRKAKAEQRP